MEGDFILMTLAWVLLGLEKESVRKLEMAGQDMGLLPQRPKIKDPIALPCDHPEFGPGNYRRQGFLRRQQLSLPWFHQTAWWPLQF